MLPLTQRLTAAYTALLSLPTVHNDAQLALAALHDVMVAAALGGPHEAMGKQFVALQDSFEWNTAVVLQQHLTVSTIQLTSGEQPCDTLLIANVVASVKLLQGMCHLHNPSQRLFSRASNLSLLLRLVTLSTTHAQLSHLLTPLLDLLLTTFIDSALNTKLFEQVGGLELLVKLMKDKNVAKEGRMKVVEVIWGWWMCDIPSNSRVDVIDKTLKVSRPRSTTHSHPLARSSSVDSPLTPELRSSCQLVTEQSPSPPASPTSKCKPNPRFQTACPSTSAPSTPRAERKNPFEFPTPSKLTRTQTTVEHIPKRKPEVNGIEPQNSCLLPESKTKKADHDPALRIRSMLEKTVADFIPQTPRHNRNIASKQSALTSSAGPKLLFTHSTPRNQTKLQTDNSTSNKKVVLKSGHYGVGLGKTNVTESKESTPKRILRHKQSASLGSLTPDHFTATSSPQPLANTCTTPDLLQTPRSKRQPHQRHGHSPSIDSATSLYTSKQVDQLAKSCHPNVMSNSSSLLSSSRSRPTTPMRSAAGKALALSFLNTCTPLTPSTTSSSSQLVERVPSLDALRHEPNSSRDNIENEPRRVTTAVVRSEYREQVKKQVLKQYVGNVDQLVKRFKEMGHGLGIQ